MVEQDKFPVVRSEGLFAFGLMVTGLGRKGATAVDGARRVWQIRDQWWGPLNGDPPKAGTEKAEDSTAVTVNGAGMAVPAPEARALQKGDRENAMVMIAELRRNLVSCPSLSYEVPNN